MLACNYELLLFLGKHNHPEAIGYPSDKLVVNV